MFTLNSVSWELGPGWAGMAHLCAVPGASAGVWLRQIAWNHMSGVSVRLSPGFLISPCGLSTWLALGSWGSIRDCSKSKSPQMQNTYQTSVHITTATVPLARASHTGGGLHAGWMPSVVQWQLPRQTSTTPVFIFGKIPGAQTKGPHTAWIHILAHP